jgi:hypothetical protein
VKNWETLSKSRNKGADWKLDSFLRRSGAVQNLEKTLIFAKRI